LGLLGNKGKKDLKSTVQMVEGLIRELGLEPDANRLQTQEAGHAWGLMKGSAEVFIFIISSDESEEPHSIQVVSPVLHIPQSQPNQLALFRRMLELNAELLSGAAFGIKGDTAVIISDRSTKDLNASEVRDMILRVGHFADMYDDELVVQFGGKRHSD
jgi:hypothetical protein